MASTRIRRLFDRVGQKYRRLRLRTWVLGMSAQGMFGRRVIVDRRGPVVSLTTHGDRVNKCHLAIESIARGSLRPSRLILWLDNPATLEDLPRPLRRLQHRGLEIALSRNYGPHTKYYPYVTSAKAVVPLVTADDDVVYPRDWLAELVAASEAYPTSVIAYRARRILLGDEASFLPYADWPFSDVRGPALFNFATGHSGVLYPCTMQAALRERGDLFVQVCGHADDVWLHNTAVRQGIGVRLVRQESVAFHTISGTQRHALKYLNVDHGANDRQIDAVYSDSDRRAVDASSREHIQ